MTCEQCALLDPKDTWGSCPAEPYDEATARRRFLTVDPPKFQSADLALPLARETANYQED